MGDLFAATDTLSDIVSSEFDMDPTGMGADGAVNLEETMHLFNHILEAPSLVSRGSFVGIPMHGVRDPEHFRAYLLNTSHKWWQRLADARRTHPRDEGEATRFVPRVQLLDQRLHLTRCGLRPKFHANWVLNFGCEVDMSAIDLTGPLPDPKEVRRDRVWEVAPRIDPCQRELVRQYQSLMRRVEVDGLDRIMFDPC